MKLINRNRHVYNYRMECVKRSLMNQSFGFFSKIKLSEFFSLSKHFKSTSKSNIQISYLFQNQKINSIIWKILQKIHRRIWLDLTEIRRSWTKLLDFKALQHLNGNRNEDEIPQCGSERTITLLVKCHPFGAIDDRCSQTEMADQRMRSPSMCARISLSVFYMCCDLS